MDKVTDFIKSHIKAITIVAFIFILGAAFAACSIGGAA